MTPKPETFAPRQARKPFASLFYEIRAMENDLTNPPSHNQGGEHASYRLDFREFRHDTTGPTGRDALLVFQPWEERFPDLCGVALAIDLRELSSENGHTPLGLQATTL